jgi:hypothetical protein
MTVQPTLYRHYAARWDAPSVDLKHRIVSFLQDHLNVADQQAPAFMSPIDLPSEAFEPVNSELVTNGQITKDQCDVGQPQLRASHQGDQLTLANLASVIAPVPAVLIDTCRWQQADAVIHPQRLRGQASPPRELPD